MKIKIEIGQKIHLCNKNIFKGDTFTINNISLKRPGYGLHPKNFKKLLGKKSPFNYKIDQQIKI